MFNSIAGALFMRRVLLFFPLLFVLFSFSGIAAGSVSSSATTTAKESELSIKKFYLYSATIVADDDGGINLDDPEVAKKIRIINLGPVVNTKAIDYAPTISADGRVLYFVSNRPGATLTTDGDPSHDFWRATKLENLDTNFFPPINIDTVHPYGPQSVNTPTNEGVASIAADRQTLVFTGCNRPDGYGDCDLYITDVEGDVWGKPRNLGREVNSEKWDSQPTITSDKQRIYFASNRPGPNGDNNIDIWYTDYDDETSKWKAAQNLTAINTGKKDWSPFIAPDNTTLFFASDGHTPNVGGLDFYMVKKTGVGADGKDTWSKPQLIPEPINTKDNESFLSLPASGDVMYFSSTRTDLSGFQGNLDIFMAFIPSFFKTSQVRVQVVDECSGANIPASISIVNPINKKNFKEDVTFKETVKEFIFGNEQYGNPKDSIKFIDLEITATNPQYGSKSVIQRITKPAVTRNKEEASKSDVYDVTIKLGQRPVLTAEVAPSQFAKDNPNDAEMQAFRGLLMRQVASIQLHPLLNYVFFDMGEATWAKRYILFKSPEETKGFTDERVPGGTLDKYYHVLNIFGYRLNKNPNAKIKIVGCTDNNTMGYSSAELKPDLAKNRATIVYNYFKDIWKIDPSRMELTWQTKNLPERPSNPKDSLGIVENRRTEILCEDWEVIKPILDKDPKVFPQPEEMTFTMKNGIDDQLVTKRRIVITNNDKDWNTLTEIGKTDASTKWDWQNTKSEYPDTNSRTGISGTNKNVYNLTPYKAKLIVTSSTGQECESLPITIPVKYAATECGAVGKGADSTLENYNLILFPFNSAEAGPRNERILGDYVFPRCFASSVVDIVGHTDIVGMYDANKKLSINRAKTAETGVRTKTKGVAILKSDGVGEDNPIYDNQLPEGRFYNRTVSIQIRTPLKDAKLCGE